MGTRKSRERQEPLWYGTELPAAPGHPFYNRLNEALDKAGFDSHCEESCAGFYHAKLVLLGHKRRQINNIDAIDPNAYSIE